MSEQTVTDPAIVGSSTIAESQTINATATSTATSATSTTTSTASTTPALTLPPSIPAAFARFIDEKTYSIIDSKKAPNKDLISFLCSTTASKFGLRFPDLLKSFDNDKDRFKTEFLKFETCAKIQILMLIRILYVSALEKGLSNVTSAGTAGNLHLEFTSGSTEREAWSWFAGVVGARESCAAIQTTELPDEIIRIAGIYVADETKSALHNDRMTESALFAVVDVISRALIDFWSMDVLLGKKTKLKISGVELASILHSFNHGPQPTPLSFYEDLYAIGSAFEAIKKSLKAKEAAEKTSAKSATNGSLKQTKSRKSKATAAAPSNA